MNKLITNIKLKFCCNEDWNKMNPNPKGRDCSKCCKTVIDFTNQDENFLKEHLSKNQNVCGRFNIDQVNKRYVLSNTLAISSVITFLELANIASVNEEKKQPKLIGILVPTVPTILDTIPPQLTGEIINYVPVPKIYQVIDSTTLEEISSFVNRNIDNTNSVYNGTYNIEVYITKNGKLKDIRLISGSLEGFRKIKKILKSYKFKKNTSSYFFSLVLQNKNAEY